MSEEGARLISEMGDTAYNIGHTAMLEVIERSSLSEHRKIGAAICAVTKLYESLIRGCNEKPDEARDELMLGMFSEFLAPEVVKLAQRVAERKKK